MVKRTAVLEWVCDWGWFLAWGIASSLWCLTAARRLGPTFDEPTYLAAGLDFWRTGSHRDLMALGTMPLPIDLQTLPLALWERFHHIRLDPVSAMDRVLPWARAMTLVFWWLLLVYARLAARQIAGPLAGRLAVAMVAAEPTFLAHAGLATTDISIAVCLLAFVYHFRVGREVDWRRRVGVPALWFAAAVLAKASGLVFGLLCCVVVEWERRWRLSSPEPPPSESSIPDPLTPAQATPLRGMGSPDPPPPATTPPFLPLRVVGSQLRQGFAFLRDPAFRRDLRQIAGIGMLLVFLYCGCDWQPHPDLLAWARHLPPGTRNRILLWSVEHLRIFSNAGEGIVQQIKHNGSGQAWYLLGRSGRRAVWYYFPVALTIKLSLPLLLLPLILAVLRPRALVNWAMLSALVLLVFSVTFRVQIGIRMVLPLITLFIVGLAAAVVHAGREMRRESGPAWPRRLRGAAPALLAGAGIVWSATDSARVWPEGLCYINALWGGPQNGYRLLSDSNYDWGQGVQDLVRWQKRHDGGTLYVWYFGRDPAVHRPPLQEMPLHTLPVSGPEEMKTLVRGHYLAVSTTLLYGGYQEGRRDLVTYLHTCRPIDRTLTYFIYEFKQ